MREWIAGMSFVIVLLMGMYGTVSAVRHFKASERYIDRQWTCSAHNGTDCEQWTKTMLDTELNVADFERLIGE